METKELIKILKENSFDCNFDFVKNVYNTNLKVIGVRLPVLKDIAKTYQFEDFSNIKINEYLEIDIILGFVNKLKYKDYEERLLNLEYLFKGESSWGITDSVIAFNKKKDLEINKFFIKRWINSEFIYLKRMGYVLYLSTLKDDKVAFEYILNNSNETGIYYIDMAICWALATGCIYFKEDVLNYLKKLDNKSFIKKNTIRKIKDSYRIDSEFKNKLNKI